MGAHRTVETGAPRMVVGNSSATGPMATAMATKIWCEPFPYVSQSLGKYLINLSLLNWCIAYPEAICCDVNYGLSILKWTCCPGCFSSRSFFFFLVASTMCDLASVSATSISVRSVLRRACGSGSVSGPLWMCLVGVACPCKRQNRKKK